MDQSRSSGSAASKAALSLTAGAAAFLPFEVMAQQADTDGENKILGTITLDANGNQPPNSNAATTGVSRLRGTIKETPQVVNVVSKEVLQQQNVSTLEQALRNVPGITASIGEGNGGPNGDRFKIRGFEAMGDAYRDGLRDFGVYVRDSFNYENVQVYKGPSSESFGLGTSGGVINTSSKQAQLGDFSRFDVSAGTGPLLRSTFDTNRQINDTTAVRFNAMVNEQDVADRNGVKSDRWGIAAGIGMGLGTSTTWHLGYLHQENKRTPDFGVPMAAKTPTGTGVYYPVTELGIDRETYYGRDTDIDDSEVDMVTSNFSTELGNGITLKNDTRLARYNRFISVTPSTCGAGCAAVGQALWSGVGNPTLGLGAGGGTSYDQRSWGIQNVTTALIDHQLGGLRNEAVVGLDLAYQEDRRDGYRYVGSKPPQTIFDPQGSSAGYTLERNPNNIKESRSKNAAIFASNRMWFNEQLSLLAGVRWDYYEAVYNQTGAGGVVTTSRAHADTFSPKASVIWERNANETYYLSWAVAQNLPFGQSISTDVNGVNGARNQWDPEETTTWELGAKVDFMDGRLGVTGAIFDVTKDNATYTDAVTGIVSYSGEKQRIRGVELGVSGQITDNWSLNAGYTYLDSEIKDASNAALIGAPVSGVPRHSATLWTSYNLTPEATGLAGDLTVAGGVAWRDGLWVRSDKTAAIPHSMSIDAMVSYEVQDWTVALNAYNLTDRVNYDTNFQGSEATSARVIPSSGRTFTLQVAKAF